VSKVKVEAILSKQDSKRLLFGNALKNVFSAKLMRPQRIHVT